MSNGAARDEAVGSLSNAAALSAPSVVVGLTTRRLRCAGTRSLNCMPANTPSGMTVSIDWPLGRSIDTTSRGLAPGGANTTAYTSPGMGRRAGGDEDPAPLLGDDDDEREDEGDEDASGELARRAR